MKAFWLSEGSKAAGSMAVFLATAEETRSMIENRLAKIGGQIASVWEFSKLVPKADLIAALAYLRDTKISLNVIPPYILSNFWCAASFPASLTLGLLIALQVISRLLFSGIFAVSRFTL